MEQTAFNTLQKGEASLVLSRPANGKIGWTISQLLKRSAEGEKILAFALQSSRKQYDYMGKKNGQETLGNWVIYDQTSASLQDIEKAALQHGADILYIDSLEHLVLENGKSLKKQGDFHHVLSKLKELAETCQLSLVIGKDLPKQVEARENKRPSLHDVKLSKKSLGLAEQLIGLYRDEVYHPNSDSKGIIEVISLKEEDASYSEPYSIR